MTQVTRPESATASSSYSPSLGNTIRREKVEGILVIREQNGTLSILFSLGLVCFISCISEFIIIFFSCPFFNFMHVFFSVCDQFLATAYNKQVRSGITILKERLHTCMTSKHVYCSSSRCWLPLAWLSVTCKSSKQGERRERREREIPNTCKSQHSNHTKLPQNGAFYGCARILGIVLENKSCKLQLFLLIQQCLYK